MSNSIDAEIVNESKQMEVALRPVQAVQPAGLFGTSEPIQVVEKATSVANALKQVIVSQGLVSKISGKEYPRCEAWTLLGTMLGVFPVTTWTRQIDDGWEARVEAKTRDGAIIGAAEAQCLRSEKNWANRDDFALRSMAQTRATAKCLRMPLGFVMTLAGFEATPAEEMTFEREEKHTARYQSPASGPSGRSGKTTANQGANQQQRQAPPQQQTTTAPVQQYATDKTREHMRNSLDKAFGGLDLVEEYFRKLSNPSVLMPNEGINDLPVEWVPLTGAQLRDLKVAIMAFGEGAEAKHPYPPNPLAPVEVEKRKKATEAKKATEKPPADPHHKPTPAVEAAKRKDPEWFFDIICPIPRKGMKRDAYLRAPDTIGSLYKATKDGDQDAQKRLFGFANNWNPEPRPRDGGGTWPVTHEEINFREALDAFLNWEEKHHGEAFQLEQESKPMPMTEPLPVRTMDEDDVPF